MLNFEENLLFQKPRPDNYFQPNNLDRSKAQESSRPLKATRKDFQLKTSNCYKFVPYFRLEVLKLIKLHLRLHLVVLIDFWHWGSSKNPLERLIMQLLF